jgi:1,4-dihydroxy-2-naphthoate octaprenyltransferase
MLDHFSENNSLEPAASSLSQATSQASSSTLPVSSQRRVDRTDSRRLILSLGLDWLKYTGIWSITALAWTVAVYRMTHLPHDLIVLSLIGLLTFISYNHDHLVNHAAVDDQINTQQRADWISAHRQALRSILYIAIVLMALLLTLRQSTLMPIGIIALLTVGYNTRHLFGGYSLRQIPGIKAFYVALGSVLCTVVIPLTAAGSAWTMQAKLLAIAFFCFYSAISNVLDIRDIVGDRLVGTQTLPVLLGEKAARWISVGLLCISAICAGLSGNLSLLVVSAYLSIFAFTYQLPMSRLMKVSRNLFGVLSLFSVIWIG